MAIGEPELLKRLGDTRSLVQLLNEVNKYLLALGEAQSILVELKPRWRILLCAFFGKKRPFVARLWLDYLI